MSFLVIGFIAIFTALQNVLGQTLFLDKREKNSICTESKINHLAEVEAYLKTSVAMKLLQMENTLDDIIDNKMSPPENQNEKVSNTTEDCQDRWTKFRDSCYFHSKGIKLAWWDALTFCQSVGATFAAPTDGDENDFLKQSARESGELVVWIGISDAYIRGQWLSYPDMTPINITDWGPTEPNYDAENCVEMYRKYDYRWNDSSCSNQRPFICEKPA